MAVATHVSRVAKDYAPYGYSIMETATATVFTESAGTVDKTELLLINDDADIYIESITVFAVTAVTADNVNYLTMTCASFDSGGTGAAFHMTTFNTKVTGGGALVVGTQYAQTVLNPIVASGRQLVFKVAKATADTDTNDREIAISVRYRRKA
jgi:hypothetical protein